MRRASRNCRRASVEESVAATENRLFVESVSKAETRREIIFIFRLKAVSKPAASNAGFGF
jgi:hypothetical protein